LHDSPDLRPEESAITADTGLVNPTEARTMTTSIQDIQGRCARRSAPARQPNGETWWSQHREASLNWLALGLLLAAWNGSNDDPARLRSRPQALRRYSSVSVRAAALHCADLGSRGAEVSGIHESVNIL
jgi:hypothetical protein